MLLLVSELGGFKMRGAAIKINLHLFYLLLGMFILAQKGWKERSI